MEDINKIIKCKHCGGDIAIPKSQQYIPEYHKACAWYERPCDICGKPIAIHRDWIYPPKSHKDCKEAQKSKCYTKPCEYCGELIKVYKNAVAIPKFHKKCAIKAQKNAGFSSKQNLRVFLCHSSNDKPKIRELYQRLCADGITPWLDEEQLLPGQDWHHEITKAVRNSHVVIVCLSSTAINKAGYIQKEIKSALDIADEQPEGIIFLIPLKLEECDIPNRLQKWQWVNFFEQSGYRKLLRALRERANNLSLFNIAKEREKNINHV